MSLWLWEKAKIFNARIAHTEVKAELCTSCKGGGS